MIKVRKKGEEFFTHDLSIIGRLCPSILWFQDGSFYLKKAEPTF